MAGIVRRVAATGIAFLLLASFGARPAAAQSVTEFPVPTSTVLNGIAVGADGALWFAEEQSKIGRITTAGAVTEFAIPTTQPQRITAGPDGALWFTSVAGNTIGQITTAGAFTLFPIPTAKSQVTDITVGADGALWFTEGDSLKIAFKSRFDASISEFKIPNMVGAPEGITAEPDGTLWFPTDVGIGRLNPMTVPVTFQGFNFSNQTLDGFLITRGPDGALWFTQQTFIGRIALDGTITDEIPLPPGSNAFNITTGPDGAVWFSDATLGKLGRMSTTRVLTEFPLPSGSSPFGIVTGPDGAMWFTDNGTNSIGRMTVPAATSPLFSATLPASRSIQIGHTATAFATIINSSANTALNCGIAPITSIPGGFMFQTTDPKTNALTGTPNIRVSIAPNTSQSFVVAFSTTTLPDSAQVPIDVVLGYDCDGFDAAATIVGVNTILLTFDANPVPDVIAIGLTPSNDGFAHTGGVGGVGLFATASSNVGVGGTLTARVRLSDTTLPITATVCETNPGNGACLSPPGPTVSATINQGQNQTWSVFLQANGTVAADPAHNRAFLEFVDVGGVVRGSTSTAVTTQ